MIGAVRQSIMQLRHVTHTSRRCILELLCARSLSALRLIGVCSQGCLGFRTRGGCLSRFPVFATLWIPRSHKRQRLLAVRYVYRPNFLNEYDQSRTCSPLEAATASMVSVNLLSIISYERMSLEMRCCSLRKPSWIFERRLGRGITKAVSPRFPKESLERCAKALTPMLRAYSQGSRIQGWRKGRRFLAKGRQVATVHSTLLNTGSAFRGVCVFCSRKQEGSKLLPTSQPCKRSTWSVV